MVHDWSELSGDAGLPADGYCLRCAEKTVRGMNDDKPGIVRILVIEDNPIDTRAIQKALRWLATPTEVEVVVGGDEAIGRLAQCGSGPDLILLDLNLAGRDGFDVLEHVQSTNELRHVPVLVLTTSSNEADVRGAYERGANAYVTKPTDLDGWKDLMTRIQDFWFSVVLLPAP